MADSYGLLTLPVPAPVTTAAGTPSVSDPALDVLLGFLQAVINAYGATAWASVRPNPLASPSLVPVLSVFSNNPEEESFNSSALPALFAWRGESNGERIADDYETRVTRVSILWVPPVAQQITQRKLSPFRNAIDKIVDGAIFRGRDPNWIVAGDTDALAATQGSVLIGQMGLCKDPGLERFAPYTLRVIHQDQTPPDTFIGLMGTITITELWTNDLADFAAEGGLDLKIATTDGFQTGEAILP